jgi:hypothetical protein
LFARVAVQVAPEILGAVVAGFTALQASAFAAHEGAARHGLSGAVNRERSGRVAMRRAQTPASACGIARRSLAVIEAARDGFVRIFLTAEPDLAVTRECAAGVCFIDGTARSLAAGVTGDGAARSGTVWLVAGFALACTSRVATDAVRAMLVLTLAISGTFRTVIAFQLALVGSVAESRLDTVCVR